MLEILAKQRSQNKPRDRSDWPKIQRRVDYDKNIVYWLGPRISLRPKQIYTYLNPESELGEA